MCSMANLSGLALAGVTCFCCRSLSDGAGSWLLDPGFLPRIIQEHILPVRWSGMFPSMTEVCRCVSMYRALRCWYILINTPVSSSVPHSFEICVRVGVSTASWNILDDRWDGLDETRTMYVHTCTLSWRSHGY